MSMTDPISDMLTRIRNAGMARLEKVEMPMAKMKVRVAEILRDEGYITSFRVEEDERAPRITLELRYDADRRPVIKSLRRLSKPGRRVYAGADDLPLVKKGLGVCIVSTSQGLLTDREARRRRLGGELVCEIW